MQYTDENVVSIVIKLYNSLSILACLYKKAITEVYLVSAEKAQVPKAANSIPSRQHYHIADTPVSKVTVQVNILNTCQSLYMTSQAIAVGHVWQESSRLLVITQACDTSVCVLSQAKSMRSASISISQYLDKSATLLFNVVHTFHHTSICSKILVALTQYEDIVFYSDATKWLKAVNGFHIEELFLL